jgi:hypothetical protein
MIDSVERAGFEPAKAPKSHLTYRKAHLSLDLRHLLWYLSNELEREDSNPRRLLRATLLTVRPICPDLRHLLWYLPNKVLKYQFKNLIVS